MKRTLFRIAVILAISKALFADAGGKLHWAATASGTDSRVFAYDTTVLDNGDIAMVGEFWGEVVFGQSPSVSMQSLGEGDGFVALYRNTGELLWARQVGGPYSDRVIQALRVPSGLEVRGSGFSDVTVSFGRPDATTHSFAYETFFLANYSPNGNLLGSSENQGDYLRRPQWKALSHGPTVEVGRFHLSQRVSGKTGSGFLLESMGHSDAFLAEFDNDSEVVWAISAGGTDPDWATGVGVDTIEAACYVTGTFESSSLVFHDAQTQDTITTLLVGEVGCFLARYSLRDIDRDGLSDLHEDKFATDVLSPDSDSDNFFDGLEVGAGYDPLSGSSIPVDLDWAIMSVGLDPASLDANDNDILDADEFALLLAILGKPSQRVHTAVRNSWLANVAQLGVDTDGLFFSRPIGERAFLSAYLTIGDSSSVTVAANYISQQTGIAINPSNYDFSQEPTLSANGDANCDLVPNLVHYLASSNRQAYLDNALSPDLCLGILPPLPIR